MFLNQPLPKIYIRNDKECYLDTIREKLIYVTPEEVVRQKIISYLLNELEVPKEMISVEENLAHYGLKSKRRADIIIHKYDKENDARVPVAVIECKATGVLLGEKACNQVLDYADELLCDYVMLTDGSLALCYKYNSDENIYTSISRLPKYKEMIDGVYELLPEVEFPKRIPYDELEKKLENYIGYEIGENTEVSKAIPILNLWECLLDKRYKMPTGKYEFFDLIEDYGVRLLSYGDAGGGIFSGPYRSFLLNVNGNTEFVSIGLSTYITFAKPDIVKTSLNVAIDNEKTAHHSLQLVIDDNMDVIGEKCVFNHHGRIGISNIGSGRISELRSLVEQKYPQIIKGRQFHLGTLTHNKLWNITDEDIVNLIENLITYALLRDEYREYVKKQIKK